MNAKWEIMNRLEETAETINYFKHMLKVKDKILSSPEGVYKYLAARAITPEQAAEGVGEAIKNLDDEDVFVPILNEG
jgi:hypothetical protein